MGIAGMDATDQRIKVVFNLFAGLDDDPAARDLVNQWGPDIGIWCPLAYMHCR
jgi:aromatic ring-opening dioxygenase catalytic subunit (LigB family)